MGKLHPRRLSNLFSGFAPVLEHQEQPAKIQDEPAAMPVATSIASIADMLAPKQSSKLRRLSQLLPKLKTSEAKLHKDREPPSLPRPRDFSPYQHHEHTSSQNTLSQPPPTRAPPSAPLASSVEASADENAVRYTNKLRHDGPPSRTAPIPRQEDFEDSYSVDQVDWQSGQHSQSPSPPPPQIYTPPPRTDSRATSPHTLDYRRPRAESLLPSQSQQNLNSYSYGSRSVSTPLNSRPDSTLYASDGEGAMGLGQDIRRRSSVMFGNLLGSSRPQSRDRSSSQDRPWVIVFSQETPDGAAQPYAGLDYLMTGQKV